MEKNTMQRKTYAKPCVEFVDFSLAGSIAASCVYEGTSADKQTCGYKDSGYIMFTGDNGVCNFPTDKDFCYHVPTVDNSVFGS